MQGSNNISQNYVLTTLKPNKYVKNSGICFFYLIIEQKYIKSKVRWDFNKDWN